MKGFIPIEIPTKRYIKAYLLKELGLQPMMTTEHQVGTKFYDLLQHRTNERKSEFANKRYNDRLKVYVSYHVFTHRGANLNETNIKNFNLFLEKEIKRNFRFMMDFYIELFPSFEANLPEVRRKLGIDLEDWDTDSMKKDYYRYRRRHNKPLLYNKNSARTVPSGKLDDLLF